MIFIKDIDFLEVGSKADMFSLLAYIGRGNKHASALTNNV
jgi:hypothetical protein